MWGVFLRHSVDRAIFPNVVVRVLVSTCTITAIWFNDRCGWYRESFKCPFKCQISHSVYSLYGLGQPDITEVVQTKKLYSLYCKLKSLVWQQ